MKLCQRILILSLCIWTQSVLGQNVGERNINEQNASAYEMANSEYFLVEAEKFALLEDYEKALVHLDKAIDLDKANHAAFFKKAEILSIQEKYDEAALSIEMAIELKKDNRYYYVLAAQIRKQQDDKAGLATIYGLMIENTQGWEIYGEEAVNAYVGNEQLKEALELVEPLMQYYPNYPELWLKKAELEIKTNRSNRSIKTLEQAFNLFPDDDLVMQSYVQSLMREGNFDRVESILSERASESYKARLILMEFYATQDRSDQIESLVIQNFNDESADLETKILSIGYLLESTEHITLADSLQISLVNSYSEEPLVFENGGFVYTNLAERATGEEKAVFSKKAIDSFKSAALLNPNNFEAWLKVFEFEIEQKQWNELENDVEYLLDLYPNQAVLYYYYAKAFKGQNDSDEAMSLVDQGLRMASRNEQLKSLLLSEKAGIFAAQGNNDKADATFNQALNTSNIDERAIFDYAEWLLAVNPPASIELMETFSSSLSKGSKWTILKMKALIAQELYQAASQTAIDFLTNFPNGGTGTFYEMYGDTLYQMGELESALVQWQKALTLGGFSEKLEEKIANKSIN